MANIKSAKKRIKVIDKKTAQNRRIKENLKKILKDYNQTLASGDLEAAAEKRTLAEKALKKAASRHTISKQSANRKVSQITRKLNAAKAAE
ncbi:30S ribosomal protein S20 [Hornefia porci]|uniref:Small ribosomal subunit protein bS20 n=1 Tax=Hornefia porci TaxID=2652292 RepID=A0A1Q9JH23_9FIRM|nr:30S ribosomal protein S20 [Hornefia porci]OLR55512.1 30S ribosomal protein S20 [Hornefia porci]